MHKNTRLFVVNLGDERHERVYETAGRETHESPVQVTLFQGFRVQVRLFPGTN